MVTGKVKYVKLISFLPAQFSWLSFANRFCALSFIAKLVGISVSFLTHFRWFLVKTFYFPAFSYVWLKMNVKQERFQNSATWNFDS